MSAQIDIDNRIRHASAADIPFMVDIGEAFHKAGKISDLTGFDRNDCANGLQIMLDNPSCKIIVGEVDGVIVGMIAYIMFPLFFSMQCQVAQEIFFYVYPSFRRFVSEALLTEAESMAEKAGMNYFILISLKKLRGDVVGKWYTRRGYEERETHFYRRLR